MLGPAPPHAVVDVPAEGSRFTAWTLAEMARLVHESLRDLPLVLFAREVALEEASGFEPLELVRALQGWVRREMRYVPDPVGIELVQSPRATLRLGAGDCDDLATLLAALAGCVGVACRFRAIDVHGDGFDHVYVEADVGRGDWIAAEVAVPDVELEWVAPERAAMIQPVSYA